MIPQKIRRPPELLGEGVSSAPRQHSRPHAAAVVPFAISILTACMSPAFSWEQGQAGGEGQEQFSLIQGHGVAVCDAYLKELNQAQFNVTPFCARPDEGFEGGFTPLKPNYWGPDRVLAIFTYVNEFMVFDNQFHVQRFFAPNPANPDKPLVTASPADRSGIGDFISRGWMLVWSYKEPIDIENDGSPRSVLFWQGYGVGPNGRCGTDHGNHPWTDSYIGQRAFILSSDGKTINERLTRAIFGAPEESSPARLTRPRSKSPFLPYGANPFRPFADSIGVFGFRGRYYIETENRPKTENGPLPPVMVYLREHNNTAKVCALRPENVPSVHE